jgi:hypothetical protein
MRLVGRLLGDVSPSNNLERPVWLLLEKYLAVQHVKAPRLAELLGSQFLYDLGGDHWKFPSLGSERAVDYFVDQFIGDFAGRFGSTFWPNDL